MMGSGVWRAVVVSACNTQQAALHGPNPGRWQKSLAQALQVAAVPPAHKPGAFRWVAVAPTSGSPAGISHHSKRSAQMHCWLQGIIDSRFPAASQWSLPAMAGPDACHTKCLSHPPRPGCGLSCVCLHPPGDELQSLWDLKSGVMGVPLRAENWWQLRDK